MAVAPYAIAGRSPAARTFTARDLSTAVCRQASPGGVGSERAARRSESGDASRAKQQQSSLNLPSNQACRRMRRHKRWKTQSTPMPATISAHVPGSGTETSSTSMSLPVPVFVELTA